MVTNKDILKALPMSARMKAHKNADKRFLNAPADSRNPGTVLAYGFIWGRSKQGYKYWKNIADNLGKW